MRAFDDLDVALIWCHGQLLKVLIQHVVGSVLIPLSVRDERWDCDPAWVVHGFALAPKIATVLQGPIGRAQHGWRLKRTYRIGCPCCIGERLEPPRWNQVGLLASGTPVSQRASL